MPFTITRRPDGGVICNYEGVMTLEDNRRARLEMAGGDFRNFADIPYIIGDYSDVEKTTHSTEDMKLLGQTVAVDIMAYNPDIVLAVVAPKDLPYGLGRVFLAYTKEVEKIALFRNREDAETWVKAKLNNKKK